MFEIHETQAAEAKNATADTLIKTLADGQAAPAPTEIQLAETTDFVDAGAGASATISAAKGTTNHQLLSCWAMLDWFGIGKRNEADSLETGRVEQAKALKVRIAELEAQLPHLARETALLNKALEQERRWSEQLRKQVVQLELQLAKAGATREHDTSQAHPCPSEERCRSVVQPEKGLGEETAKRSAGEAEIKRSQEQVDMLRAKASQLEAEATKRSAGEGELKRAHEQVDMLRAKVSRLEAQLTIERETTAASVKRCEGLEKLLADEKSMRLADASRCEEFRAKCVLLEQQLPTDSDKSRASSLSAQSSTSPAFKDVTSAQELRHKEALRAREIHLSRSKSLQKGRIPQVQPHAVHAELLTQVVQVEELRAMVIDLQQQLRETETERDALRSNCGREQQERKQPTNRNPFARAFACGPRDRVRADCQVPRTLPGADSRRRNVPASDSGIF